jgi:threonine aldolase
MRQGGIIAAGALYALEHNVERLAEDHANARRLAEAIAEMPGLSVDLDGVQTNMVFFEVEKNRTAAEWCAKLTQRGVRMLPVAPKRVRAVTHLDVSAEDIDRAIAVFHEETART